MKSQKINLIIIAISILIMVVYVMLDGVQDLIVALKSINAEVLILGVAMMTFYWLLEAGILHRVIRKLKPNHKFKSTFKTTMIGQYFNCITPFSSGGQPIQAYHMVKTGIELGKATTALLGKFIVYQITLTLTAVIVIFFNYRYFSDRIQGFGIIVIGGVAVAVGVVVLLLSIGIFNKFTEKVILYLVRLIKKLRLIKNTEKIEAYIKREMINFGKSFKQLKKYKFMLFDISLMTIVQILIYLAIPYIVYISFGLSGAKIIHMITANLFVMLVSSFVPMPGAIGGAEISFFLVFKIFFPEDTLSIAILIWRLITFYMPIIVGMFFTFDLGKKPSLLNSDAGTNNKQLHKK